MVNLTKTPGNICTIGGTKVFMNQMEWMKENFNEACYKAVEETKDVFYKVVRKAISIDIYSLSDLRALDHPLARRHGTIQWGIDPKESVHTRSGDMLEKFFGIVQEKGSTITGMVGWKNDEANDIVFYVLYGTRTMLPRNILWVMWERIDARELFLGKLIEYARRGMHLGGKPRGGRSKRYVEQVSHLRQIAREAGW